MFTQWLDKWMWKCHTLNITEYISNWIRNNQASYDMSTDYIRLQIEDLTGKRPTYEEIDTAFKIVYCNGVN